MKGTRTAAIVFAIIMAVVACLVAFGAIFRTQAILTELSKANPYADSSIITSPQYLSYYLSDFDYVMIVYKPWVLAVTIAIFLICMVDIGILAGGSNGAIVLIFGILSILCGNLITGILMCVCHAQYEKTAMYANMQPQLIQVRRFCNRCGAPIKDGDAFCAKCGNRVE